MDEPIAGILEIALLPAWDFFTMDKVAGEYQEKPAYDLPQPVP